MKYVLSVTPSIVAKRKTIHIGQLPLGSYFRHIASNLRKDKFKHLFKTVGVGFDGSIIYVHDKKCECNVMNNGKNTRASSIDKSFLLKTIDVVKLGNNIGEDILFMRVQKK